MRVLQIGDLVEARTGGIANEAVYQRGIVTVLSDCCTMAWVAWMHLAMKETRIPSRVLEVVNADR